MTRALAGALCAALLGSCTTPSPCEAQGGRCTRVDVDCPTGQVFVGYDPHCDVNNKCCVPVVKTPPGADAGDPSAPCVQRNGTCQSGNLVCMTGTNPVAGLCAPGNVCCVKCCP